MILILYNHKRKVDQTKTKKDATSAPGKFPNILKRKCRLSYIVLMNLMIIMRRQAIIIRLSMQYNQSFKLTAARCMTLTHDNDAPALTITIKEKPTNHRPMNRSPTISHISETLCYLKIWHGRLWQIWIVSNFLLFFFGNIPSANVCPHQGFPVIVVNKRWEGRLVAPHMTLSPPGQHGCWKLT